MKKFWIAGLAEEKLIDVGNGNLIRIATKDLNSRSGANFAFLNDREVNTAAATEQKFLDDVIAAKFELHFIARHARLRHHEHCGTDPQAVSDQDRVFV